MTNKEKKDWLAAKFPLTVIRDRYDGTYSGAMWLAFPLPHFYIPDGTRAADLACANFWKDYKEPVGKGAYANDAVVDLIQQMREFEPEESEDEKIRKWLIEECQKVIDMANPAYDTHKAKEAIAWLEKQKTSEEAIRYVKENHSPDEVSDFQAAMNIAVAKAYDKGVQDTLKKQKENPKNAISIPADCVSNVKCVNRWYKVEGFLPDNGRDVLAKDALGNFLIANYDGDRWYISGYDNEDKPIVYTPAIKEWCDIPSEKQKEQKPDSLTKYVYSKEDKKFIQDCANILVANDYTASAERLLSMFEQKPAEWSEEDKEMIERLIRHTQKEFNELCNDRYGHQEIISDLKESCRERMNWLENRLKSLRPQPKQEWNEEDSKRYISIGTTLGTSVVLSKEDYDANMAWLRELVYAKKYSGPRPHWKPSDEQIQTLIKIHGNSDMPTQQILGSLITELNNLRKL